jgi:phage-related tail protein
MRISKSTLVRTSGALLILLALAGWLLSLGGLFILWNSRPQVEQGLADLADLAAQVLDTTGGILQVIEDSLVQSADTLTALQSSLNSAAGSFGNSVDVMDQLSVLVGVDLVCVVDETQTSLQSASTSAKLVDDTLGVIAAIPFVGKQYQPEVTLSQSINNISLSLEGMRPSLTGIQVGIDTTSSRLDEVYRMVLTLTERVKETRPGIYSAMQEVDDYQQIVADLQEKNAAFKTALPGMLSSVYTLLSVLLGWAALSQFSTFVQGLQLFAPGLFKEEGHFDEPPVA